MRIEKDFKEFIELLNKNNVHYLIVDGFAYSYHAEPRYTKDIDLFIESTPQNADRIIKALNGFGFENIGLKSSDFLQPEQIIQLGYEPVRIDIITSISGVDFESAWKNKIVATYGKIPAFFISKEDLIKTKLATGRDQDLIDIKKLKKIY